MQTREKVTLMYSIKLRRITAYLVCAAMVLLAFMIPAAENVDALTDSADIEKEYVTTVYNDRNGLPTGEANTVLQSSDGYIWIGSYGGLVRYDGSNFRNFSQEGELTSSSIRSIFEDSNGRLWVGTNEAGVFVFEGGHFTKIEGPEDNSFLCIRDFNEGSDGTVYVASSSGIGEIKDGTLRPYEDEDIKGKTVYSLGIDSMDRIWGAMDGGICAVVKDGKVKGVITSEMVFGETEAQIYCVTDDNEGNIFIGTSGNVLAKISFKSEKLKSSAFKKEILSTDEVSVHNRICVTENGSILVCGFMGFALIDSEGKLTEFGESQKASSVNWAATDYEGNLWLASSAFGIIKYSPGSFTSPNEAAGLDEIPVNTVIKQSGRFYVGLEQGIKIFNNSWMEVKNSLTSMLASVRVRCIVSDSDGMIWVVTNSSYGVVRFDPQTEKITVFNTDKGLSSNTARSLLELSDGRIAVGTQSGLDIIEGSRVTEKYSADEGIENTSILCIAEGSDGTIYAGSDGGGIYAVKDKNVKNCGFGCGLGEGVVLRMVKDEDSDSPSENYFVSAGSSLYYFETDKGRFCKLDNFSKGPGSIFDLYDRDGRLWLLQNNGIYSVDKMKLLSGETAEAELYGFSHGLTGSLNANTWNYMDSKGRLYLATRSGISIFGFHGVDNCIPRGVIQSVQADDKVYEHPESLALPKDVQRLTISFAALSYSDTSDFEITYMLEGFDKEEKALYGNKTETVSYTNLPGGDYTFRLHIFDPENPENGYEYALPLTKEKELSETPVVWVLAVLIVSAIIGGIVMLYTRAKMNHIRKEKEAYRNIVDQSMKTFANTIDAKDSYTNGHSIRVARYSREIARRMGLSEEEQENIYYTAMLHDIGKIGIPDSILNKPDKLTKDERDVIQTHVSMGGDILKNFNALEGISDGARYHHERYDGKGYCSHIKGDDIPLTARIICVADTYDAMSSDRCYRKALPQSVIREELIKGAGTQFDPEIVPYMLEMMDDGTAPYNQD